MKGKKIGEHERMREEGCERIRKDKREGEGKKHENTNRTDEEKEKDDKRRRE